jgi:luciferase family oxidoreductase group 1
MLSHYSPLKVAENFRMLETLFPGRIDLGIGRAPGSDQLTALALQAGPGAAPPDQFAVQVRDLLGFLNDSLPSEHPFARVRAMPAGATAPEPWLLGSSDQSASLAAYFGCPFSYAHFISHHGGEEVMALYREHYRPSAACPAPRGNIGVFVICADTEAAALHLAKSRNLWLLRLYRGETGPYPTPEQADAASYGERDRAILAYNRGRTIAGAPEQVRERLEELGRGYGVDEFVVVTICHDFAARLRSYELLAQVFGLAPRGARPIPVDAGRVS